MWGFDLIIHPQVGEFDFPLDQIPTINIEDALRRESASPYAERFSARLTLSIAPYRNSPLVPYHKLCCIIDNTL